MQLKVNMQAVYKVFSETFIYGLCNLLGRTIHYILVPIYTHILLPQEYGIVNTFYTYAALLTVIYNYNMDMAYFKFAKEIQLPHYHRSILKRFMQKFQITTTSSFLSETPQEYFFFCLSFSTILCSSVCFTIFFLLYIHSLTFSTKLKDVMEYGFYLVGILITDSILNMLLARLRLKNRPYLFSTIKLFQIICIIFLNVLALYLIPLFHEESKLHAFLSKSPIEYIFLSNLLANIITLMCCIQNFSFYHFIFNWKILKEMFGYSFPLFLITLSITFNEVISRIALQYYLPDNFYPNYTTYEIIGIFGACYKISVFMLLFIQAFRYAAEPFFFVKAPQKDAPVLFSEVMQQFIVLACLILFCISLNLDWLGKLFLINPAYRNCLPIVPYLLLSYLFLGIYYNLSIWYKITKKNYFGLLITLIGNFIMLSMNYYGIPIWGYWASVYGVLLGYGFMIIISYILGQKYYPIPYKVIRGLLYIFCTFGTIWFIRSFFMTYLKHPLFLCFINFIILIRIIIFLYSLLLFKKES